MLLSNQRDSEIYPTNSYFYITDIWTILWCIAIKCTKIMIPFLATLRKACIFHHPKIQMSRDTNMWKQKKLWHAKLCADLIKLQSGVRKHEGF